MRSVLLLSVVVTAAISSAVGQAASPADQSKQNLCMVAGRVITAAEGTPLKSAHVVLIKESRARDEPNTYSAATDESGVFILKDVVPGRYTVYAEHTGYVNQQYQSQSAESGAVLGLRPRQVVSDILFRLILAGVVTGRVTDEDEEPMDHIQVVALRRPSEEEMEDWDAFASRKDELFPAGSARTNDRGEYCIFGLTPGDYYLQANESMESPGEITDWRGYFVRQSLGDEYAPVYYPGVLQRSQAETISLRPGDEAQIDFSMRHVKTVEVAGRVLAPDGKPANAMVELQDAGVESYTQNRNTNTDAEGKFRLKGVPPGGYVLVAYQQTKEEGYYRAAARQEVQVGNEDIESITIALSRGADFTGRITADGGRLPDHIYFDLRTVGAGIWGSGARVKPDGSFELKGVHEGNYAMEVNSGGDNWYVKSAHLGSDDVLEHGLNVEKGTSGTLEIVIAVGRAQLEGTVTEDDKPAIAAHVRIVPDSETPYNRGRRNATTTDQNGQFVLSGIAPGKYRVIARSPTVPGGESAKADPQFVTLSENEHKTLQVQLRAPQNQ